MDDELKRIIALLLDEYSERLSNDGCNEWQWPDGISDETKRAILSQEPGYIDDFGLEAPGNAQLTAMLVNLLRQ